MKPSAVTIKRCIRPLRANHSILAAVVLVVIALLAAAAHAQTGEWTWTGGPSTIGTPGCQNCGVPGVYGTLGVPGAQNLPGGRTGATIWADSKGNLWLFGGLGVDAAGATGYLNDLWRYDASTHQWVWLGGNSTLPASAQGSPGSYGALGQASPANVPGGRARGSRWTDANGDLWLFGGIGIDSTGMPGYLNDLWTYSVAAGEWTWVGGSDTVPGPWQGVMGMYGTLGTAGTANTPGGRKGAAFCQMPGGNFWLFGGEGFDSAGNLSDLNDLWQFDPTSRQWTWTAGQSTLPAAGLFAGNYGTLRQPSTANFDGGREGAACALDNGGNVWIVGGLGQDVETLGHGWFNDLWRFDTTSLQWTWLGGNNFIYAIDKDPDGHQFYGEQGQYEQPGVAGGGVPGGRGFGAYGTDSTGQLWMFGGNGIAGAYDYDYGLLNDLWMFSPTTGKWTWFSGSAEMPDCNSSDFTTSPCGVQGVYGSLGVAAAGNTPGARTGPQAAFDPSGRLWMLGGDGFDSAGTLGPLNDMWMYTPDTTLAAVPTPSIGMYSSNVQSCLVGVVDSWPGVSLYYTTDGSTPDTSSTLYSGPFTLTASATIQAIAFVKGYPKSDVASTHIDIVPGVAAPTFSPPGGNYPNGQSVTISDTTPHAVIYYTTDGSTPTIRSTKYTKPIWVSAPETIRAIAAADSLTNSNDVWASYFILHPGALDAPVISPNPGTYDNAVNVTLFDAYSQASINYYIDYSASGYTRNPGPGYPVYSGPIHLTKSATVSAAAYWGNQSTRSIGRLTSSINLARRPPLILPPELTHLRRTSPSPIPRRMRPSITPPTAQRRRHLPRLTAAPSPYLRPTPFRPLLSPQGILHRRLRGPLTSSSRPRPRRHSQCRPAPTLPSRALKSQTPPPTQPSTTPPTAALPRHRPRAMRAPSPWPRRRPSAPSPLRPATPPAALPPRPTSSTFLLRTSLSAPVPLRSIWRPAPAHRSASP